MKTLTSMPWFWTILSLIGPLLLRGGDAWGVTRTFTARTRTILGSTSPATDSFIETQLRDAAMRLHTRDQSPKEGQAPSSKPLEPPYVPTHMDYLRFLVDSQHVYQAFEDICNNMEELAELRNTGLERTQPLEKDIDFMCREFRLERPPVGEPGLKYAETLRQIKSVPEFICHFYNFYFAHTAGGRMIGKKMSALLLDNRTLEFYKWDEDLNTLKRKVKDTIEHIAAQWSVEEREECIATTASAFEGAGKINSYLSGGQSPH